MKKLILLLIFLMNASILFAEIIELKAGQTIEAKIIKKTESSIQIDINGIPITYYWDEIEGIDGQGVVESPESAVAAEPVSETRAPEEWYDEIKKSVVYIRKSAHLNARDQRGAGTGFIIDPSGVIISNLHVVAGSATVQVQLHDRRIFPVEKILYYDLVRDVCVFQINAAGLPTINLGDSDKIIQGQEVFTVGNPEGKRNIFSRGRILEILPSSYKSYFRFSIPVKHGNSGGPVLNLDGEAVGILYGKTGLSGEAIPVNDIKSFLNNPAPLSFSEFRKIESAQNYYLKDKGQDALGRQDIDESIQSFTMYLNGFAGDAEVQYFLGQAYWNKGDIKSAINHWEYAAGIASDDFKDIYYKIAFSYHQLGDFNRAIENYQKFLQRSPGDVDGIYFLGLAYADKQQMLKVSEQVHKLEELGRDDLAGKLKRATNTH